MPKKQNRKERRRLRQKKAVEEYRAKMYERENEVLQPGCMSHTASALKHHYYPKTAVNAVSSMAKALKKTIKKRLSTSSNVKVHPKNMKGGKKKGHNRTKKKKRKKRKKSHKSK